MPGNRRSGKEDSVLSIIAWLVVGALAGWIAGMIVPGDEGYGWLGSLVAGIVGALVGGFILGALTNTDWTTGIDIPTIIAAIVGAIIVVYVWKMVAGRGRTAV
jgi:uncharacterized membrane protein YeaQ/YmgE (transglycosylase-associated protein family)